MKGAGKILWRIPQIIYITDYLGNSPNNYITDWFWRFKLTASHENV
jgi:hypothetical protein